MEPMHLGSPQNSPATSPNISYLNSNAPYLPSFLIGGEPQQTASTSPGRSKTPAGTTSSPAITPRSIYPNNDPRNLRQKLFNQSLSESFQTYTPQEKGGPPKHGLFDTLDKSRSSRTFTDDVNNANLSLTNDPCFIPVSQKRSEEQIYHASHHNLNTLWVTVFGFPPSSTSIVLAQFASCGTIIDKKHPTQGNWMHVKFSSLHEVAKALAINGKVISNCIMIGVRPHHNTEDKENLENSGYTSPIRARSLRLSYANPQINTPVIPPHNVPQKSTGLVTKAMEYVFGW